MEYDVNLDRAVILKINYPIGTKEKLEFVYNLVTTLTDEYEVLISKSRSSRVPIITIPEGAVLSRATNVLTWNIEFNYSDLKEGDYYFEIRNKTLDVIEYKGTFKTTKTIKND